MTKRILLIIAVVSFGLAACKKEHPEREDLSYKCECGQLSWKGQTYQLALAEYVSQADTTFDRNYYISADIGNDGDDFSYHLNVDFQIDDVLDGVYFPDADSNVVVINIEEVSRETALPTIVQYEAELGIVNVTPAINSGDVESVTFNLQCREVINSVPIGEPLSLVGNMQLK